MRSLRTKLILIMVLLIIALMTVVGSFLINGVENFYTRQFYNNMDETFSTEFIAQMQTVAAENDAPAQRLRELLMAQSDLAIDLNNRNVYVLDQSGAVLAGSDGRTGVSMTANLLAAMNGQVGQTSSIIADYMDVAIPIRGGDTGFIVYVLDNKTTVNALTSEVITIILESLGLGLVISVVLAVLLAQILIRPIQALTEGARQIAAGSFSDTLDVASEDEIGTLTQNFNEMARILQDTLEQVNNERNKLSTLFLHMTDGVVAFDAGGELIHYNPAAVNLLGIQLSDQTVYEELFSDVSPLDKLLRLPRTEYIEAQRTAGDRELELFLASFSDTEAQGGVLALIHDVTVQRRNEEMNREFVANVSHELRTPLTNVRSYTETILDAGDELPAELKNNFLNVVLSETDRMTRIVQDLLTLSRFDSGRMEMNMARFDFADAVQSVYQAVTMSAQEHGHTLTLELEPQLPAIIGDRQRIEQVIMNILSNAIKYTPDGGLIRISAGGRDGKAWVNVTDNGIGIPKKDIPRLFERFYRVDKARSRESGGTGLGLSIALEILNLHKGEIHVESDVGKGTSVTISLPAVQ